MRWKKHPKYKGYLISDTGLVKRIRTGNILKPWKVGHGYERVEVYRNSRYYSEYIHRLVAETFLPKHPMRDEVNHKDGDKTNNHVNNLEWVTRQENMTHGLAGKPFKAVMVKVDSKVYPSIAEAARALDITTDKLHYILAGTVKTDVEVMRVEY